MSQPESGPTISQVYDLLKDVLKKNIEIKQEIVENKTALTQEIQELRKDFNSELTKLKQTNEDLREENNALKKRLDTIDRKLRKFNIVLYGLKEEGKDNDVEQVLQIFNKTLRVCCKAEDFRDCFRIGTVQAGQVRPLHLEAFSYKLKSEIIYNANKLKGTGLFITHDYIASDYLDRKLLSSNLKV
nr:unnamed protein product [Callosobruchus analis]